MNRQDHLFDEPGLEGPDYVALVIEWDDIADTIQDEITKPIQTEAEAPPTLHAHPVRWIATAVGALAALHVAAWGVRRLRAA